MGLLSGLEKFGLSLDGIDITEEKESKKKAAAPKKSAPILPTEEKDFLLKKEIKCAVCDKKFSALVIKGSKAKRMEPDSDLRPRFQGIDTVKYDVYSCPYCGYAAMSKSFESLAPSQLKWVREAVCQNFKPSAIDLNDRETYTYEEAVDRLKLALVSAMAKRVKLSEKAYICLKIAWLRREQIEQLSASTKKEDLDKREAYKAEYENFYRQAYDGFMKVSSTETPPFYGLNQNTLDYMLANMALYFKDYQTSAKLVSSLLTSTNTPSNLKDKCFDLKQQLVEISKKQKAAAAAAKKTEQ